MVSAAVPKTERAGSSPVCATIMNTIVEGKLLEMVLRITEDERYNGEKVSMDKLRSIVNEWRPVLTPTAGFFHDSWSSIVDIYFGDFQAAKERLTDEGAELMSRFGDSIKKIDEKLQK